MSKNIYDFRQWWAYVFMLIALLIVIATVYFSNSLSANLAQEETNKAEEWAESMKMLVDMEKTDIKVSQDYKELEEKYRDATSTLTLMLVDKMQANTSIPVILYLAENDSISGYRNIDIPEKYVSDVMKQTFLKQKMNVFKAKNKPIEIKFDDGGQSQYLYYDDSVFLKRLLMFPYIQLSVVFTFIILSFLALISIQKAEQNKVWVGLSKETAHQLGTPISSLIAWVEYLKTKEVDNTYLKEMEKDVKRLETIADRFSKIGSQPDMQMLNINDALQSSYEYMSSRISSKVVMQVNPSESPALVLMNDALFSWVIENLTKNAVDAMEGQGNITYQVENNTKKVYIDVSDSGKGISKSKFKTIFNPGYTTKTRGWGLGLSLVKRIIASYPGGKIYVKQSEIGKGTTIRIELRKYEVKT